MPPAQGAPCVAKVDPFFIDLEFQRAATELAQARSEVSQQDDGVPARLGGIATVIEGVGKATPRQRSASLPTAREPDAAIGAPSEVASQAQGHCAPSQNIVVLQAAQVCRMSARARRAERRGEYRGRDIERLQGLGASSETLCKAMLAQHTVAYALWLLRGLVFQSAVASQ